jgi:hypothetical protein
MIDQTKDELVENPSRRSFLGASSAALAAAAFGRRTTARGHS